MEVLKELRYIVKEYGYRGDWETPRNSEKRDREKPDCKTVL